MITRIVFFVILLLLLLLESTLISYPFVFVLIFLLFMRYQTIGTLVTVLIIGFMLDSLRVVSVGITPLFSFGLFFILFLYNRSLHLGELALLLVACFAATLLYSSVAHYPINLVLHVLVFTALFVVVYTVQQKKLSHNSPFGPLT